MARTMAILIGDRGV